MRASDRRREHAPPQSASRAIHPSTRYTAATSRPAMAHKRAHACGRGIWFYCPQGPNDHRYTAQPRPQPSAAKVANEGRTSGASRSSIARVGQHGSRPAEQPPAKERQPPTSAPAPSVFACGSSACALRKSAAASQPQVKLPNLPFFAYFFGAISPRTNRLKNLPVYTMYQAYIR